MRRKVSQFAAHSAAIKYWLNGLGISTDRRTPPARVMLKRVGLTHLPSDGLAMELIFEENATEEKQGGSSFGR